MADDDDRPATVELDPREFVTRPEGRRAWVREGRRALEAQRERERRPIAKERSDRLFAACRRLEEELEVEHASHAAYQAWRARGIAADGSRRMAPGMVKPHEPALVPTGVINTTDHDSRVMRTQGQPPLQGDNAQLSVNDQQVIVAAEVTTDAPDFGHLEPLVRATRRELQAVDLDDPAIIVADAGYWHQRQIEAVVSDGIQVLVPPDSGLRKTPRRGWTRGLYDFMRRVLATPDGRATYRTRQVAIEPVFGQLKFNRLIRRFQRRGRAACRSEYGASARPPTTSSSSTTTAPPPPPPETRRRGRAPLTPKNSLAGSTRSPPAFPTASVRRNSGTCPDGESCTCRQPAASVPRHV
jgi:Transposase DDE domain